MPASQPLEVVLGGQTAGVQVSLPGKLERQETYPHSLSSFISILVCDF